MTVGEKLRLFADSNFASLSDFAKLLDMKPSVLQYYLRDKRKPGTPIIQKLIKIGVNASWLLANESEHYVSLNTVESQTNITNSFSEKFFSETIYGRTLLYEKLTARSILLIKEAFEKELFDMELDYYSYSLFKECLGEIHEINRAFNSDNTERNNRIDVKRFNKLLRNFIKIIEKLFNFDSRLSDTFHDLPYGVINFDYIQRNYFHVANSKNRKLKDFSYMNITSFIIQYNRITELMGIFNSFLTQLIPMVMKHKGNDKIVYYEYQVIKIFFPKIEKLIMFQMYSYYLFNHYISKREFEYYADYLGAVNKKCIDYFFGKNKPEKSPEELQFNNLTKEELSKLSEIINFIRNTKKDEE
jgi:transcriptional regulator with XRE-family HTH domain